MIGIIDYGLGNVHAIKNVYHRLNIPFILIADNGQLLKVSKLILPGVGAFDWAMECLNQSGMREALDELVMEKNIPVLGICVGMQLMAKNSEEGNSSGLGWLNAEVKKFHTEKINDIQIPHMGWNSIINHDNHPLFKNVDQEKGFYFLHSYYFECNDKSYIVGSSKHGLDFTAAVSHRNIYGVQFHPEKSHINGINLFKNFANI